MTQAMVFRALRMRQPVGELFVVVARASEIISICEFEYRHALTDDSPDVDFMGIQRPYSKKRISDISKYVLSADSTFPTSVVISVDDRCVVIEYTSETTADILLSDYVDDEDSLKSISLSSAGRIIDGQHRLKGIENASCDGFQLPVTIFVGADDATRASVFSTVNLAQTKVNKSIVYDLFAVAEGRSPQKTAHEIVVALDSAVSSPFRHRIKRLGSATRTVDDKPIPGREFEPLSQATIVRGILSLVSKTVLDDLEAERKGRPIIVTERDRIALPFRRLYADKNDTAILINIANFFNAVKGRWPTAWNDQSTGAVLNKTNGFDGLIRFLGSAYPKLVGAGKVVSTSEYTSLLAESPLSDRDFTTGKFPPGTGGATALYKELTPSLEKWPKRL